MGGEEECKSGREGRKESRMNSDETGGELRLSGKKSSNSEFWTNLLGATCIPCAISQDFERRIAQSSVQGLSWWEIDIAKNINCIASMEACCILVLILIQSII